MSVEIDVGLENAANVKVSPVEPPKPEAPAKPLTTPKLRRRLMFVVIVLVALAVGLFLYYLNRESTDDAQVDGHITPVASKIYGRVSKVLIDDNQPVKAGQVVVQIDPGDYQAAVDQAKAALALAEDEARSAGVDVPRTSETVPAVLRMPMRNFLAPKLTWCARRQCTSKRKRPISPLPKRTLRTVAPTLNLPRRTWSVTGPLMEKGEISKQQFDAAKANADATASALVADEQRLAQAKRNIDITRAQLDAAKARVEGAKAGVSSALANQKSVAMRSADAQAKLASVDRARGALDAAQLNLSYCNIVAPVDGVATHKSVEPGQIVQAGQGLLVVVPLQNVWVTANFKETQLRNMKPGQKAEIKSDTYGKTFSGHVDSIAGATGAVLSLLPPENATGNYVKVVQRIPVKIVLDPISPDVAVLRPGMNVEATVITK